MNTIKNLHSVTIVAALIFVFLIASSVAAAATLNVGSNEEYKTIQSAADAANDGDTINVTPGTYNETVNMTKSLTFIGTNDSKVDGFYCYGGRDTISGFTIQKYGVIADFSGGVDVRNNSFYDCGVQLSGSMADGSNITNNQITNGTINLYDVLWQTIAENTISNSKYGIYIGDSTEVPTVTNNTFKNCDTAIYFEGWEQSPGRLLTFSNNTYIDNRLNFGWGTTY